jgi:hypothetical protein
MTHYDEALKVHAQSGLRSAADWLTLGREVEAGAPPRTEVPHRGVPIQLYTRDQTRPRRSRRAGIH